MKKVLLVSLVIALVALVSIGFAERYCTNCGASLLTDSDRYCSECGADQMVDEQAEEQENGATVWPQVSYNPVEVYMFKMQSESGRRQGRGGPGKSYLDVGAYKPYKVASVKALIKENDYVLVDLKYPTVGHRRIYFQSNYFENMHGVTEKTLQAVAGEMIETLIPRFGPGNDYDQFKFDQTYRKITAGTPVQVLMQENEWLFVEWMSGFGAVRVWVPVTAVR